MYTCLCSDLLTARACFCFAGLLYCSLPPFPLASTASSLPLPSCMLARSPCKLMLGRPLAAPSQPAWAAISRSPLTHAAAAMASGARPGGRKARAAAARRPGGCGRAAARRSAQVVEAGNGHAASHQVHLRRRSREGAAAAGVSAMGHAAQQAAARRLRCEADVLSRLLWCHKWAASAAAAPRTAAACCSPLSAPADCHCHRRPCCAATAMRPALHAPPSMQTHRPLRPAPGAGPRA